MSAPKLGFVVRMEAKPGKAAELQQMLTSGLGLIEEESLTIQWFAIRVDATHFVIVDSFAAEEGRQAHLNGEFAKALFSRVDELLVDAPTVERVDILAAKLP